MRRVALIAVLAAALGAAACDRAATSDAPSGVVSLTIRDYRYDHQNVRVRRGAITFAITNDGRDDTNFRVRRRKKDLVIIATLKPGEFGTTTAVLRPGEYVMYSSVGRHEELGEYGRLTVTRR